MIKQRFRTPNAVGIIIIREINGCTEILLQKRNNQWDFAAGGHVEENESLTQAVIREAKEEIGISVCRKDIIFSSCSYTKFEKITYNFFYFVVKQFKGKPSIKEPTKCQDLKWYDINYLPGNIIKDVELIVRNHFAGIPFTEIGWN